MFSQTMEYALRSVVWLASHCESGHLAAKEIAKGTKVPSSYLAKVLQDLVQAKIISSRPGVSGGFKLKSDPKDLSILEVINAIEPFRRINGCPLKLKTHRHKLCPMHYSLDAQLEEVEKTLKTVKIVDILRDPTRPIPMCESAEF